MTCSNSNLNFPSAFIYSIIFWPSVCRSSFCLIWSGKFKFFVFLLTRLYKETQHTSKCCPALLYIQVSTASHVTVKLYANVWIFTSFYQQYQDYKMCRHCYVIGVCTKWYTIKCKYMYITCMYSKCSIMIALWLWRILS